jgi:hypothetical protein
MTSNAGCTSSAVTFDTGYVYKYTSVSDRLPELDVVNGVPAGAATSVLVPASAPPDPADLAAAEHEAAGADAISRPLQIDTSSVQSMVWRYRGK